MGGINTILELFGKITNKLLFEGANWEEPPLAKLLDLSLLVLLRFESRSIGISDRASKKFAYNFMKVKTSADRTSTSLSKRCIAKRGLKFKVC